MTTKEFHQTAVEKLSKCSVKELKKEALKYNNDFTTKGTLLFDAIIDVLEKKMKEDDFTEKL